jgi:hypothetical protein
MHKKIETVTRLPHLSLCTRTIKLSERAKTQMSKHLHMM